MNILGIESSCDETAAAVVVDGVKILSNVVASSQKMHAKTGGIIPEQAAREQIKSIIPVINESLKIEKDSSLDAIAVTVGPGLIGSLLVGAETAKTLAWIWKKPIIPVNHLTAHLYANFIKIQNSKIKLQNYKSKLKNKKPEFPALGLVVSGGHTDLVLMHKHGNLEWIGGTRDDAAGEAFDKCARLLGLPYPGGPSIAEAAMKFQASNNKLQLKLFPRPLIDDKSFDFSFSGLKTAVLREIQSNPSSLHLRRNELAAQIQEAIVDSLIEKSIKAIKEFLPAQAGRPKSFLLAGGVAANKRLEEKFKQRVLDEKLKIDLRIPPPNLCTDNAVTIASYAFFNYKPVNWRKITARPELTIAD